MKRGGGGGPFLPYAGGVTPAELSRAVQRAVRGAVADGELFVTVPERVVVRAPMPGEGGGSETDLACNVALRIAKEAGRPPREVAEVLGRRLVGLPGVGGVEIAGAGFLNVMLTRAARAELVGKVRGQGQGEWLGSVSAAGGTAVAPVALRAAGGVRAAVVVEALERILPAGGVAGRSKNEAGEPRVEVIRPRPVPVEVRHERERHEGPHERGAVSSASQEWRTLTTRLGPDEARWVLLRAAQHDVVRLPVRPVQRESNGRFRVQYAYARTCAMTRNARELGFAGEPGDVGAGAGGGWDVREVREVWAAIAEYPGVVEAAARHRAPDRVARHLEVTADAWLRCHDVCPPLPVGEEKPSAVHRARLALAEAAGTVLAHGLHLLGISTPERL
ncbi:ArgS-related anticodon-binding protein NrtL [Streptomyces chrestomyceticus]|uniref:ArgS-related anticodon-binding protein NrtL n=1 Tax=Streptomyces chrestomyceticus TaxID=68185 RepID=UPI0036B134BA